jgi:2-polyprenyl-3-methyl-5-hydroxy-6-metoxy-1,4-benzoquinol methylase
MEQSGVSVVSSMDNKISPQVSVEHYQNGYDHKDRWISYFHQIDSVLGLNPGSVLEIGPGNGTVSAYLRGRGINVTTADIDPKLNPDVVASVTDLPFKADTFDVSMACEVLEHLPFEQFVPALSELARVSKDHVIISLPDARRTLLYVVMKFPFLHQILFRLRTLNRKPHKFDGEHYWELGKREVSFATVHKAITQAGFSCEKEFVAHDAPFYHFFVLRKS